ncbi:hypothetical protein JOM56_005329 [Amanita muscaria]
MVSLLTLPHELVERILLLLATESVQTCKLVNRALNEIIQSSTLLQYFQACQAAGVIDNPQSLLSYAERLEALKKREEAWRKLKPVFEMSISVNRRRICHSIEGVFFLSDENEKDLNYCHLPSFPQDKPQWTRIPGHGPALDWSGMLINAISALYEHDLIVNFISSDIGNQADMQRHSLDLVLLKFSTGEYHPLARHPRIHVQRSPEVEPLVVSRIVGDNLALVVHSDEGTFSDKLFIFDWKTGCKRLQHGVSENAYSGLTFVSAELLVVPNRVLSHFEVWHLPPSQLNPKPPVQILSLKIPGVSPEYSLRIFRCYGEPNPILHSVPYLPPRPFFSSPENSIIMVAFRISSNSGRRPLHELVTLQLFQLLKLLEHFLHHVYRPTRSTLDLPWAKWGPPISRWFQVNETQVTRSHGQRYAFSDANAPDGEKLMVSVVDFNPHKFRRNAEMMARLGSGEGENNGNNEEVQEEKEAEGFEILDHKGVFSEEVYMGLKCLVYRAPDEYDFDLVLMEEKRLFGVKLDRHGWEESIKVFYIG